VISSVLMVIFLAQSTVLNITVPYPCFLYHFCVFCLAEVFLKAENSDAHEDEAGQSSPASPVGQEADTIEKEANLPMKQKPKKKSNKSKVTEYL
jgi:hypothetical protein